MTSSLPLDADTVLAPWMAKISAAQQILIAYSGGLDSTLLLKLLCQRIDPARICAVHVNHGLSANADRWQAQAADFCAQIGVQFRAEKVTVEINGKGLEAAARHARYAVFERLLEDNGILFLAQHADDQVETVFYRILRGSGPKGLAGMPSCRALGSGTLIRPLLLWQKSALQNCAQQLGLQWTEDESNHDNRFDRNYLRNRVIATIANRWPDYAQSIQRSAQISREAEQLTEILAREDLAAVDLRQERAGWSICIPQLLDLPALRQRNILRYWSGLNGLAMPSQKIIDEITQSVLRARSDSIPKVVWQSQQWTRFQGRLYLLRMGEGQRVRHQQLEWSAQEPLQLTDTSRLVGKKILGEGLCLTDKQSLRVGYRRGGERCKPAGRQHSNSLKKLFLEYRLQPWWRDSIPLLYVDETLVAVGDLWICEGWAVESNQRGIKINWQVNSL